MKEEIYVRTILIKLIVLLLLFGVKRSEKLVPITRREPYFSTTNDYYSQLREQSDLAIYGYSVNQYTNMIHYERINLLMDLIGMGLITKA